MADGNLVRELKQWAAEEFGLSPSILPDSYIKTLCVGTGKSIWKYVVQHVFNHRNVRIMRGNLQWYKVLRDKENDGQSEAARRRDLQRKIEQLQEEISHLDTQISGAEEQLATQEQSISQTWVQVEDSQRRELLLQAFKQRCIMDRKALSDDTQMISGHCQDLERMKKKGEIEVLFESKSSSSGCDNPNSRGTAEAQVLREVRELCNDRVLFYQSLQDSELKAPRAAATHMTREQRAVVFQHWLSAVEDMLSKYPPNQIISVLQYLASTEQREMEEKLPSLDVTRDVTALQFRYESDHLLDISTVEENSLPPVKILLQAAWEDVERSFVELAQTRTRVQQLRNQMQDRRMMVKEEMSGLTEELQTDTTALSALDVELRCVMQAAACDHIREQCLQLDQHSRSRQEALKNLHDQWQKILDFRQLVELKQEHMRGLIKGNSDAKMEITHQHLEIADFVQGKLVPLFSDVVTAASKLRNCVSQEAKQLGTVSLHALDRRTVDGISRVPAMWLSIHRLESPSLKGLCQSMEFPLYRAPEGLCSQARSQQLELRVLRQLLQHHSATLQEIQKEEMLLHEPDQKSLLRRVGEEDQKLLKTLVPRVRALTQCCAQGIAYSDQVKAAISYWWDQPAQYVLPEACKGGLSFRQWLQRWKLAAGPS